MFQNHKMQNDLYLVRTIEQMRNIFYKITSADRRPAGNRLCD